MDNIRIKDNRAARTWVVTAWNNRGTFCFVVDATRRMQARNKVIKFKDEQHGDGFVVHNIVEQN